MNSEINVYSYPSGEIQRVQVVRWEDWSGLKFCRPTYNPASLECFYHIYKNFLVPGAPWIFGQLVMVQMPEDVTEIWEFVSRGQDEDANLEDVRRKYKGIKDVLTVVTMILKDGVRLVNGCPQFRTAEAKNLWAELESRDCLRIVSGKLPHTQIIPVGNFAGYLSGESSPLREEEKISEALLKVNSSFFIMDPIDCATVYDQIGAVLGLCVEDGVVLNPPMFGREALLVGKDGKVSVQPMDVQDLTVEINGMSYKHGDNAVFYTRPQKKKVRINEPGKQMLLVIVGTRVVDVITKGSVDIPASGFVMCVESANGGGYCDNTEVSQEDIVDKPSDMGKTTMFMGATIAYHGLEDVQFGIQVGNSIIRDGVKTDRFISRFYNIRHLEPVPYPPSLYPMDFEKGRAARIALGADKEGKPMLFWAEGAGKFGYVPGEGSCGASLSEMAEIAEDIGMTSGINLDGGGSAQILYQNKRHLMISDRKKEDHSEAERLIPLGLVVR